MKRIFKRIVATLLLSIMVISTLPTSQALAISNSQMADKVISIAQNEVGYKSSGQYSKYGEWYGHQGSWCTYFALWCFNEAGNSLGVNLYGVVTPKGANCNSMISWYTNKGRYYKRSTGYNPRPGDLVFFDWNGNGGSDHVGIVKSVSGSKVYTVEGNCSGEVKARSYQPGGRVPYGTTDSIMGYASIDWGLVSGSSDKVETTKKETTTKKKETTTKKKEENTKPKENPTTTTTTTTTTTKAPINLAKSIKIESSIETISVGDTIKLNYSVEPVGSTAVVGYFCDQEDVVDIEQGGKIKAKAPGTAIVVLCANNDIYDQYTLNIVEPDSGLMVNNENIYEVTKPHYDETFKDKLITLGVNVDALMVNKDLYFIPLAICGFTLIVAGMIGIVKKIAQNKSKNNK